MTGTRSKTNAKAKAAKLESANIESIATYIKNNNVENIIVMCGAGISTKCGIPDFRSKGTGLYDNLQKFDLPYAEAIFDIDYFEERPEAFYTLAKELYPGKYLPTKTHYFIKLLDEKKKLLRNFTQNIDTLERLSGLDQNKVVEAHGSFATASCIECHNAADNDMVKEYVLKGDIPRCESCKGLIKPDITFFGQNLPKRFYKKLSDFDQADLLIVIGTSLQVQPFASLIDHVADYVPRLLINKDVAGVHNSPHHGFDFKWKYGHKRDVLHLGDCDEGIEKLADLLGWKNELDKLYEKGHARLKAQWLPEEFEKKEEKEIEEEEEEEEEEKEKEKEEVNEKEKEGKDESIQATEGEPDNEIEELVKDLKNKLKVPEEEN